MIGLILVCLLWAGMVAGISFLEAPVKFTAPSLTLPIGLDVGRHVFGVFNKVEIGFALIAMALALSSHPSRVIGFFLGGTVLILALQTLWLLPILDSRVTQILNGQMPPRAPFHVIYIVLEGLKLVGLLGVGVSALLALSRAVPQGI